MPEWLPEKTPGASIMAAFGPATPRRLGSGEASGRCQLLELSVVRPRPMARRWRRRTWRPIRPSASAILTAGDRTDAAGPPAGRVPALLATGVRGVLIGAIVTGETPEGIRRVTREFVAAVRAVG